MEGSSLEWRIASITARDARLRRPLLRMVIYKIVAAEEWAKAQAAGVFAGARYPEGMMRLVRG